MDAMVAKKDYISRDAELIQTRANKDHAVKKEARKHKALMRKRIH
jgi:hypothetical protein